MVDLFKLQSEIEYPQDIQTRYYAKDQGIYGITRLWRLFGNW